jgi:hypothetical protein
VGIDEAGHGDHFARVDHLIDGCTQISADRLNCAAGYNDLGILQDAEGRIERDDPAGLDEGALHCVLHAH